MRDLHCYPIVANADCFVCSFRLVPPLCASCSRSVGLSLIAMSSAYRNVVKGKLSLKGSKKPFAGATGGVKRKKEQTEEERIEWENRELERLIANKKEMEAKASEAAAAAAAAAAASSSLDGDAADKQSDAEDDPDAGLTKSERDFQRAQRLREKEMIQKKIAKTHRQRVEEYNTYLGNLSEHNDIPRVGPG